MSDPIFYRRQFLNEEGHHSVAAVLAEIKEGDDDKGYLDFGATLQIADCNRSITLDFGVFGTTRTAKERKELRSNLDNARLKAARLRTAVNDFISGLETELDRVEYDLADLEQTALRKASKKSAKKARKAYQKAAQAATQTQEG
jgi:hypothetical protein